MLELDVLLMPFFEQAFDGLAEEQQVIFEKLLTCDDPDLYAWFMGHQSCEQPEFAEMIQTILNRVKV
jgi:antitoxin CptB